MATDTMANGPSSIIDPLAPEQTYTVDGSKKDTHRPTVEEVVDEEDLAHPPPSAHLPGTSASTDAGNGSAQSEKAAGKQKATDENASDASAPAPKAPPKLDVTSEEAFPSLGAPKGPAIASTAGNAWGKKPAGVNGVGGVVNGKGPASSVSSRASTPASGMRTPASAMPSQFGSPRGGGQVNLPGRHTDYIQLAPSELIPPNQLRTSRQEIIRDINRRSKANVEMKVGGAGNMTRFVGTGPPDAVHEALQEVAKKLGAKKTINVSVPASLRPHIIGRGGATIKGIMERTGARIQVPKQEGGLEAEDDDTVIDIAVEGNATACGLAKREIDSIVNDKTSTVNLRMKEIPPEYFPFLAGPRNSRVGALEDGRDVRVQIPQYYQWTGQAPVPPASTQQPAVFAPQARHGISISGDREQAQQVQAELERQYAQLRRQITMDQMSIERGRHQFIVGERGQPLHEFLEDTGCTVILPPAGDNSEDLFIVGPADKIDKAKDTIMELASNMAMATVDVARAHAQATRDAQLHARNVTRYLRERQAIEQLERAHNTTIVCPECRRDAPTAWELYAKEGKNTMRARADIMNLINGHPPSRMRNTQIDPFFHQQLQQEHARQIRREHGVHVLFPSDAEAEHFPDLVLVYEAPGTPSEYELPRRQPSAADVKQFEQALAAAEKQLLGLIAGQQQIASRDIDANPKFHDKVRRYVDREQSGLPGGQFPVQLLFGQPVGGPVERKPTSRATVRGPSAAVDDMAAKILAFLEQEEKDEKERGFTMSFDFPQKYAQFLIGKRGENINALRDEFDVNIQAKDDKVTLTGPKAKCEACKKHIEKNLKKWEDEKTYKMIIKPEFHRELIGQKGAGVNRLQDRYGVRIQFPRSTQNGDDDAGTETGSVRNAAKSSQRPDEVVVRGPSKGADAARDELLEYLSHLQEHSFQHTISVSQEQVPRLIGQGGREMDKVRIETKCQIEVPNSRDAATNGRVDIKLKGSKKQVEQAKAILEAKVREFDDTVVQTIEVDKALHKDLIGAGGQKIRDIVIRAGGPTDSSARTVRFPPAGSPDSTIRVEGPTSVVEKVVKEIKSYADEQASQITLSLTVPQEKHRQLIGRSGETKRQMETQFNVRIDVPRQGSSSQEIKIRGRPDGVEKAKARIEALVKEQEGVTVNVPKALHHHVADNGQIFRQLRSNHRVIVDHGGRPVPPKPTTAGADAARAGVNGGHLPLITDDPGLAAADAHRWEVVDAHGGLPEGADADTIPWILRAQNGASPDALAKAQAVLEKALEDAKKPTVTGYLILPDPRFYRYVVGPGGRGVNSVRNRTGCKVTVPKGGNRDAVEAIEVAGGRDEVEEAKEMILELVRDGEAGRRN